MGTQSYRVSIPRPHTHLLEVEARYQGLTGASVDLTMAAWTPGSYLIREYARHVQDVSCSDEAGRPLPVRKVAKNRWRVERGAAATVIARYRVYAHELTVRTSHVDDSHAFWNGAPTYLYCDELRSAPQTLTVEAPRGWHIDTALTPTSETTFAAADLDELLDSPVECGVHPRIDFTAAGRPHRIALWGLPDGTQGFDARAFAADVTGIIEAHARVFGGVPYHHYLFILHLSPNAYGGLEHRASSTLLSSPTAFHPRKKYEELLELISHEYFHLWNVKRIRPRALGPFDYETEAYTRSLWVMEGLTSYYDRYTLRRAGLLPATRYLEKLGEEWGKLLAIPGRRQQSIADSSFDAWIKLYRPDENSANSTVSYYLKGSIVALALDLEVRARSRAAGADRSLDDVLRLLWRRYGEAPAGFEDDGVRAIFEEATGLDLGASFAALVDGTGEIDLEPRLATVGLRIEASYEGGPGEGAGGRPLDGAPAWLGAKLQQNGARAVVANVPTGSPSEAGGLYAGDELLALDGYRVDERALRERLASRRPGDVVTLTVFRRDQLRTVAITLGERPRDKFDVVALENAGDVERAAYLAWMGEPWPPLRPKPQNPNK